MEQKNISYNNLSSVSTMIYLGLFFFLIVGWNLIVY